MTRTIAGNFFEDFRVGQTIRHATPRTVTTGDVAIYNGLFGARFAVQSSDAFAKAIGYPRSPIDDLLVFHIVFGKTVPDISLNAVANLGYANCRFLAPVYPGDTLGVQRTCKDINPREGAAHAEVRWDCRVTNQKDALVAQYDLLTMVARTWPT